MSCPTSGNRPGPERAETAKTFAVGCDRLHGKEEVDLCPAPNGDAQAKRACSFVGQQGSDRPSRKQPRRTLTIAARATGTATASSSSEDAGTLTCGRAPPPPGGPHGPG